MVSTLEAVISVFPVVPLVTFDTRSPTRTQFALAILVLITFFAIITVLHYRMQFTGLSTEQQQQKSFLQGQREDQNPESERILISWDEEKIEQVVRSLFDRERTYASDETTTLRGAFNRIILGWRRATEGIPSRALAVIEEGAGILILGAFIFVPIEVWRRYLTYSPPYPSFAGMLDYGREFLELFVQTGTDTAGAFPYAGILFNLGFAYSILLAEWLYHRWWLTGSILILSGISIWYLEKHIPSGVTQDRLYYSTASILASITGVFILIWLTGVSVSWIGSRLGEVNLILFSINFEFWLELLGFLLALFIMFFAIYHGMMDLISRLTRIERRFERHVKISKMVPVYMVIQRFAAIFGVLMAPFLLIYFFVAIAEGRFQEIGSFLITEASFDVQLLVLASILALIAAFAFVIRDDWQEIRDAWTEAMARKRVRLLVFTRFVPMGTMFITYILAWSFGRSFIYAVAAAILVGILTRIFVSVFNRAKYRIKMIDSPTTVPQSVLVETYEIEGLNGEELYYTRVNGTELAHDDYEGIVQATMDAIEDVFTEGSIDPSVATWHARNMFRFGIVSTEETQKKIKSKLRREIFPRLRQNGGVIPTYKLEEKLSKYPESIKEQMLKEWRLEGTQEGRIEQREGYTFLVTS